MTSSVMILSAYFVVWAVVHSLLASLRVKDWVLAKLGAGVDRWYRLAYVIFATAATRSTVTTLPMVAMGALLPDRTLYVVPTPWRWLMIGGQVRSPGRRGRWPGAAGAVLQTGPSYFLGLPQLLALSQLLARRSTDDGCDPVDALQVQGFYCYVRHPLYLFAILFVWLTPAMTVNLATLYGLITLYFVVGSVHEEGRLATEFGAAYRAYQRQVPRLIPRPGRCYAAAEAVAPGDDRDGWAWRIKQGKQE